MKTRAVSIVLLMIVSALAGCTSGDPDGDGELGIDTDVLNQMIEDNLQDFINNSSVTVHHTIHQHNNTTVVNNYYQTTNEYQNTTNVEEGEIGPTTNYYTNNYSLGGQGEGTSATTSHVLSYDHSYSYVSNNLSDIEFIIDGDLQHPVIGSAPTLSYNYGGQNIDFDFTCEEYRNAINWGSRSGMEEDDWRRYGYQYLGLSSSQASELAENIYDDLTDYQDEFYAYCGGSGITTLHELNLFTLEINRSIALSFDYISGYFNYYLNCSDGYNKSGSSNWLWDDYSIRTPRIGGWADCTFYAYDTISTSFSYDYEYIDTYSNYTFYPYPIWHYYGNNNYWYSGEVTESNQIATSQIYYTSHYLIVEE